MSKNNEIVYYPPLEEKINVFSHGVGLVLSVIATFFLMAKAFDTADWHYEFSYALYGLSLIVLYAASTLYHNSKEDKKRRRLNIFDHASIYVLIAGTYTPYALVTLKDGSGWLIFTVIWGLALIGVILKLFFTGRFNILSTIMYVLMGWMMVFDLSSLMGNLSSKGLVWLLVGGISYTLGAVLFSVNKLKFNHAIFHIFVLFGSISHFISIYFYV